MEEQIDKYLQGQMSSMERAEFEARCKADAALSEALAGFATAEYAARRFARKARFDALTQAYEAMPQAEWVAPARTMNLRAYALAAAAALALLVAVFLSYQQFSPQSPAELYAANVEPFPLSFQRGNSAASLQQLSQVYYQEKYPEAISLAQQLLADTAVQNKNKLSMCLGMSLLFDNQPAKAIDAFQQVETVSSFIENAQWYTALAHLKMENTDAATPLLTQIANSTHYKRKEAKAILEEL